MKKLAKNITLIISAAKKGGAGVMLAYVANVLSENYHVNFLSIYDEERRPDLSDKICFKSLKINPCGKFLWRFKAIQKIRKFLIQNNSGIVLCFMSDVSFLGRIASLGLNIIFISAERNDPYTRSFLGKLTSLITYSLSTRCVFQLEKAMNFYPKHIRKKSVVIPNPIRKIPNVSWTGKKKKTIVSAGRFVHDKGFDVLINAFTLVHALYPEYSLIIYGEGSCMEEYKRLMSEKKITTNVYFPGYINDISNAIANEGIFVLPSRAEGIPNVLIEALSVGIPTISSDCSPGGPYFLTEGGKNGLLVPTNDINALYEAIVKLIEDSSLAQRLSERGPNIISKITPDIINTMWLNLVK